MYPDIEQKHGITLKQANDLLRDLQARHGKGQSILAFWGSATERAERLEATLGDALEYLRELRGEWRWKEGAGGRNSRDFLELEKCIETAGSLLPNDPHQATASDGRPLT